MSNQKNKLHTPHENVEEEINSYLLETEHYILSYKLIKAYYNLKKINIMIMSLPNSNAQKHTLQNYYTLLNNKLNTKILNLIEKYGK